MSGHNLDVVQEPRIRVTLMPFKPHTQRKRRRKRRKSESTEERESRPHRRLRRIVPEPGCPEGVLCTVKQVNMSSLNCSVTYKLGLKSSQPVCQSTFFSKFLDSWSIKINCVLLIWYS